MNHYEHERDHNYFEMKRLFLEDERIVDSDETLVYFPVTQINGLFYVFPAASEYCRFWYFINQLKQTQNHTRNLENLFIA